ncbi:MAG TPA: hypothetical protein VD886_10320 [Herpetosiphonaceae bacterium]|nr:hypothetical protein [Herpetosiphonaceae bacterium]
MYERPPPIGPDPPAGGRWWLAPLAVGTCSGCGLLTAALRLSQQHGSPADWQRIVAEPAAIVSLLTGGLAWATWESRRRGWNPLFQHMLWMLALISFVVMVSIMRSL